MAEVFGAFKSRDGTISSCRIGVGGHGGMTDFGAPFSTVVDEERQEHARFKMLQRQTMFCRA